MTFGELLAGPFLFDGLHYFLSEGQVGVEGTAFLKRLEAHDDVRSVRELDQAGALSQFDLVESARRTRRWVSPRKSWRPPVERDEVRRSFHVSVRSPDQILDTYLDMIDKSVDRADPAVSLADVAIEGGHLAFAIQA